MHIDFNLGNVFFILGVMVLGGLALVTGARLLASTSVPVASQLAGVVVKLFNLESQAAATAA